MEPIPLSAIIVIEIIFALFCALIANYKNRSSGARCIGNRLADLVKTGQASPQSRRANYEREIERGTGLPQR